MQENLSLCGDLFVRFEPNKSISGKVQRQKSWGFPLVARVFINMALGSSKLKSKKICRLDVFGVGLCDFMFSQKRTQEAQIAVDSKIYNYGVRHGKLMMLLRMSCRVKEEKGRLSKMGRHYTCSGAEKI
jgi:hypothetical protein